MDLIESKFVKCIESCQRASSEYKDSKFSDDKTIKLMQSLGSIHYVKDRIIAIENLIIAQIEEGDNNE